MGAAVATAVATAVQRGVASGAGASLGLDLAAVGTTGASLFLGGEPVQGEVVGEDIVVSGCTNLSLRHLRRARAYWLRV